jgi:hypothetical protein
MCKLDAAIDTLKFMGPKYGEDYSAAIRILEAVAKIPTRRRETMTKPKLKPCPFCGGEAISGENATRSAVDWVFCSQCLPRGQRNHQ